MLISTGHACGGKLAAIGSEPSRAGARSLSKHAVGDVAFRAAATCAIRSAVFFCRGAAAGRDSAWWSLGALSGRADQWPLASEAIGDVLNSLKWWWFDADQSPTGWQLQLVIVDEQRGLSWAINGRDSVG